MEDSRTHIKTSIEDSARYARLLALPESLLANMVLQIFPSHTHTHFVLHPASQEFCLPAWCSVPAGSSSWQVRPLCSWMDRVDVWVIKCACGAQHAANTLPVSVPVCVCVCVCSLTERAQLLKNVFKKSTVSLYRSDSMQQNLLRKLHHISSSLCLFLLSFLPNMPREGVVITPQRLQFSRVRVNCFRICSRITSGFIIPAVIRPVSL